MNRTLALLPSGIEQPKVERMDPDAAPIMLIALESTRTTREATEFATRRIRRRIESLSGIGGVSVRRNRHEMLCGSVFRVGRYGRVACRLGN